MKKYLFLSLIICMFLMYLPFVVCGYPEQQKNFAANKTISNEEGNYTEALGESYESSEEIVIPESGVKRSVESQLKGTGLIFMPYAPGEAFPVEKGYRYTPVEPVIILPENKANKTEAKEGGGKQ